MTEALKFDRQRDTLEPEPLANLTADDLEELERNMLSLLQTIRRKLNKRPVIVPKGRR